MKFPWAVHLPEDERAEFERELATASSEERNGITIGWRATARAYAEGPEVVETLTAPIDSGAITEVFPPSHYGCSEVE